MRLNSRIALAAILTLAGCSSTPTKVDTGPIHARTFSFVQRSNWSAPGFADNREAVHQMIQAAIAKDLAVRGVAQVPTGGDVTVGYLVIIGNHVSTEAINDYFGYSQGAEALEDKAHEAYTQGKNPNDFEAGTLLIDITDGKTYKLLKRGYATRFLDQEATAEVRAERIQAVVDQILKDLKVDQ